MIKVKHLFLALLVAICPTLLKAQENDIRVGLRAGHNAVFGGFAAASLETNQTFCKDFSISGGVQYNTIGKTALEARPGYIMNFDWGRLTAETLVFYSNLSNVDNFAAGAGARAEFGRTSMQLGYYYRVYGNEVNKLTEPFNLYYELRVGLLENTKDWDLDLILTNNEIFELERHYQPTYLAECFYYPTDNLGVTLGVGYKPSGTFHIAAGYYQTFIKTSLCYRW